MELCVSTTASSVRASATATAAPISFAPLRRGASASTAALPLHRRIPTRGWRCAASAAGPDPVPASDGSASATYTYVFTEKPDTPADDKVEEASAAPPSSSTEAPVADVVSSEASPSPSPSPDDGGLGEILSKLNIEVTPTLILTGSGAILALWILSSVVAAIDSVPLLPKLLELVGTGYSIWFFARYLLFKVHLFLRGLFKESRDDLFAKFEDLIQRIF